MCQGPGPAPPSSPPCLSPAPCGVGWVGRMGGEQCGGGRARGRIKRFQSFELNVSLHCTCSPCEYIHTVRHTLDWKSALHCRLKCTARCNLQAMLQSGKTEWSKINASTLYMGS